MRAPKAGAQNPAISLPQKGTPICTRPQPLLTFKYAPSDAPPN